MSDTSDREIVVEEHPEVPWLSIVLGFGPMLPIAAGAVIAWTTGSLVRGEAILVSVLYASSILAFLAGVRRGLSFRTEGGPTVMQLATMAGLWLAAFVTLICIVHAFAIPALAILAIGYTALMILDPLAACAGETPPLFRAPASAADAVCRIGTQCAARQCLGLYLAARSDRSRLNSPR